MHPIPATLGNKDSAYSSHPRQTVDVSGMPAVRPGASQQALLQGAEQTVAAQGATWTNQVATTTTTTITTTTSAVTTAPVYAERASGLSVQSETGASNGLDAADGATSASSLAGGLIAASPSPEVMDDTASNDAEVRRLARLVVRGELRPGLKLSDESGPQTMKALAVLLASPHCAVTQLFLGHESIDDAGVALLSEALKLNRSLKALDLSFNQFGAAGAASLSEALKVNTALANLVLDFNQIGAAGAASLSQALKVNTTLTNFYICDIDISQQQEAEIDRLLQRNRQLPQLMQGAAVSLELASNQAYPFEIYTSLMDQMVALPSAHREAGLFTIQTLSSDIGHRANNN